MNQSEIILKIKEIALSDPTLKESITKFQIIDNEEILVEI